MEHFYELSRDSVRHTAAWYKTNDDCPAHFHSSIEVVYLLSGSLCVTLEGVTSEICENTLIVNSCYHMHAYHFLTESREIVATIPLSALPVFSNLLSRKRFTHNILSCEADCEYEHLLRMMCDPKNRANESYINSLAQALIALLIEHLGLEDRQDSSDGDWLRRVLSYLQQNAFAPLTVEKVAAVFGYSAGRFSHLFTKQVGIPFLQYLQKLRCEQARLDLLEGRLSISEIAEKCGFSSLRSFHRVYKTQMGITPAQTREIC